MSIYLRSSLHDFGLLPVPPSSKFEYSSLLKLSGALARLPTSGGRGVNGDGGGNGSGGYKAVAATSTTQSAMISYYQWIDLAKQFLSLSEESSAVYFDGFLFLVDQEDSFSERLYHLAAVNNPATTKPSSVNNSSSSSSLTSFSSSSESCLNQRHNQLQQQEQRLRPHLLQNYHVSSIPFLLYLFNQIHNKNYSTNSNLFKDSPTSSSSQDNSKPGSNTASARLSRSKSHYSRTYWRKIPKEIMNGRRALSKFWKSNAMKWLNLVYVAGAGGQSLLSADRSALGLSRSQLKAALNFVFYALVPLSEDTWSEMRYQFANWVRTGKESAETKTLLQIFALDDFGEYINSAEILSCPVDKVIELLAEGSLPLSSRNTGTTPTELVDSVISWTMATDSTPLYFQKITFSPSGLAFSLEESKSPLGNRYQSRQGKNVSNRDVAPFSHFHPSNLVLISGKRNQTLVITEEFAAKSNIFIYRCHDCRIYILGSSHNIIMSHCRGTELFAGVCASTLCTHHCDKAIIRGVASRFIIGMMCENLQAFVTSITSPLVLQGESAFSIPHANNDSFISGSSSFSTLLSGAAGGQEFKGIHDTLCRTPSSTSMVTFAPCNAWYRNMDKHMSASCIDPSTNSWFPPVVTWSRDGSKSLAISSTEECSQLYRKLQPSAFFCSELPFMCNDDLKNKDSTSLTAAVNPIPLPTEYIDSVFGAVEFIHDTRAIISSLQRRGEEGGRGVGSGAKLQDKISGEFRMWLKSSGQIDFITSLMNLRKDLEQAKMFSVANAE